MLYIDYTWRGSDSGFIPLHTVEACLIFSLACFTCELVLYSELDSSGSVTNLTARVSLKGKFGETNLH